MSDWTNFDEEFSSDSLSAVEDLLRLAADDVPVVRSGLRTEIITHAQKMQRELRFQHMLWGAVATFLLFAGAFIWWPASSKSGLAASIEPSQQPAKSALNPAFDSVDWELVESKNQLRRRNLEILRNAF